MLQIKQTESKTYEELMEDAIRNIPIYTREWTNFNPSDPGITILENLSAFNRLQQMSIDEVTPQISEKLFALAGFHRKPRKLARVLLQSPELEEPLFLPANKKFMLGDTPFETAKAFTLSGAKLTAVYARQGDLLSDISVLLDDSLPVNVTPWGEIPHTGDELIFVADRLPAAGEECFFYIAVGDDYHRNPFPRGEKRYRMFASMKWEVLTEAGFTELASRDETGCFLESGEIRFRMPEAPFSPLWQSQTDVSGYMIKAVLTEARYDLPPVLKSVKGFLFEVWQKETKSLCLTCNQNTTVRLTGDLPEEGYVNVFCKEEHESHYRRYMDGSGLDMQGRYYSLEHPAPGLMEFTFDKKRFGFGPQRGRNAVKIVAYSEEASRLYSLGKVFGYDNQVIDLPFRNLVSDSFSIIAERIDTDGLPYYDFVKPGREGNGDLAFTVDEDEGSMTIMDAGDYCGAVLYLCAVAVSLGRDGNIRPGNKFEYSEFGRILTFTNPAAGQSGQKKESLAELQERFLKDVSSHETAVCAEDYENLVAATPGLCISKVKAYETPGDRTVHVAVLPLETDGTCKLSDRYRAEIGSYIEKHRLLGTVVKLEDVSTVPINVDLQVYVKTHFRNADKLLEECLSTFLDGRREDRPLGGVVYMEELYKYLEERPFVEAVYELVLSSGNRRFGTKRDCDIVLAPNCVSLPGHFNIQIIKQ